MFELMDVGQGMYRLLRSFTNGEVPWLWPTLMDSVNDGLAIQDLIDLPMIVSGCTPAPCRGKDEIEASRSELDLNGCTIIDHFCEPSSKKMLDATIDRIRRHQKYGIVRTDLRREDCPDTARLFEIIEESLSSDRFHRLTGYQCCPGRYSISLAFQNMPPNGLCWHRDLEWPTERDVVTIIYCLKDDTVQRGGAFLYYSDRANTMQYIFRERHQATVLMNGEPRCKRTYHAVSEYKVSDTSRETMIIQCVRGP